MFLTHFSQSTPIYSGAESMATNAYFLGKHVLPVEKCAAFAWWGELMNRLIHRSWGESFEATIYLAHHAKHLWILLVCSCQWVFLGDKSRKGNFFGSGGALLLAGLLLGLRERGLGNREDGTHGSLQPLKWRFEGRHGQHSITSTWEVYNDPLQWICISFTSSSRCT